MGLIVEDGSGLADADSYISVANADTYAASVGHTEWEALSEPEKEHALRLGTMYVDARCFKSSKLKQNQSLEWPRQGFGWPILRVVHAVVEAGLPSRKSNLFTDTAPSGHIKKDDIDVLKTEFFEPAKDGQYQFGIINALLGNLECDGSSGTSIRVERS